MMLIKPSKWHAYLCMSLFSLYIPFSLAAEGQAQVISPSASMLKMVIGLGLVLAVMFGITWLAKRMLPHAKASNSTVKVVGGVSVGTRERVVVVEVAGRWLVVGVASGNVSAIADLTPQEAAGGGIEKSLGSSTLPSGLMEHKANSFKQWLSQAMKKTA